MARAKDIILGAPLRRPCSVTAVDGITRLDLAVTLLPSTITSAIDDGARAYAKAKGVAEPKPEDAAFLRGKVAHTVLLSCVDPDSPGDAPVPFFDDVAQIERMLDDAAQVYIVQEQKDFQDEHAPIVEGVTPEQYVQLQAACLEEFRRGGDPERPFAGLPLRVLRSFSAQSVARSLPLTELLSELGSRSQGSIPSSESSAPTSESGS